MSLRRFVGREIEIASPKGVMPMEISVGGRSVFGFIPLLVIVLALVCLYFFFVSGPAGTQAMTPWLMIAVGAVAAHFLFSRFRAGGGTAPRAGVYRIDGERVQFFPGGTKKNWAWEEPLANYAGVRWEKFSQARGDREATESRKRAITHHVIALSHADANRTVPLYYTSNKVSALAAMKFARKSMQQADMTDEDHRKLEAEAESFRRQASSDIPRERWQSLSQQLGLPAIDARDGAEEVRAAEDIGKTVSKLGAEGKIRQRVVDDNAPPPLEVETLGSPDFSGENAIRITMRAPSRPIAVRMLYGVGALFLILGVVTFQFGFLLGALLFAGVGYGLSELEKRQPRELTITDTEVIYKKPLNEKEGFSASLADIQNVVLSDVESEDILSAKTLKLQGKQLLISTNSREFRVGSGLPPEANEWIRAKIIAAAAGLDQPPEVDGRAKH